jgi:hypothetical protein
MTTYHYHIAAKANVDSILANGLRTDTEGWDTGYVWMFSDLTVALKDLPKWHTWRGGATIVRVNVDGLTVIPDPHAGWGDERDRYSKAVAHDIEPDRLDMAVG